MAGFRRSYDSAPNAIVGAARRIHIDRADEIERIRVKTTEQWQSIAWRHYDAIGEIKYAFNYFAAVASRVRFYAGYQDDAADSPTPIGEVGGLPRSLVTAARYELTKLSKGRGGQPNLIRALALNLLVVGEVYLVGTDNTWAARSISELRFESENRVRLVLSRNMGRDSTQYLDPKAYVARIWRTHPEYSEDADSSLKGVESDCSELILLARIIRASIQSRLNAGILYVADELRFQRSSDVEVGDTPQPNVDPFEEEITLALTEPIGQTDSPSEVVPMIIRGPAEFTDTGIKHIDISRSFDKETVARHDQVLNRVLNGLDIPKDIISGMAHVRYSNSITIAEDMLKAHVEPAILIICEALTTVFLKPQLIARGYDPELVNRIQVWYDPSEIVTRADRSTDADKGYERMLVSASSWRRAHGFTEQDAPKMDELIRRIALSGVVPPEATVAFMRAVAPEMVHLAERMADADASKSLLPAVDNPALIKDAHPAPSAGAPPGPSGAPTTSGRPNTPIGTTSIPQAGHMPPDPADKTSRAAQIMNQLRSITADGSLPPSAHIPARNNERNRRLELALDAERRLRESLYVHLNAIVFRSLERAGARTISKIRNDASLKALAVDIPIEEVFARLPDKARNTYSLDADALIRDTLEKARDGYFAMIRDAQRAGWAALDDGIVETLESTQEDNIQRSWSWLLDRLVTLGAESLHRPAASGTHVDIDTVRYATALAGGAHYVIEDRSVDPLDSGRAILSARALEATGWEFTGDARWVYGVGDITDDVHLQLDDQVFTGWESSVLRNTDASFGVTHFYPGDRNGCRCDWLPVPVFEREEVTSHAAGS